MTDDAAPSLFSNDDVVIQADDESFSRFMVAEHLQRLGNPKILTARSGEEALAVLNGDEAARACLVLLDFQMPGRNGIEVLKEIRCGRLRVPRDVPVMLVTGVIDAYGLLVSAMVLDVDAFVSKPLSMTDLRDRLIEIRATDRVMQDAEFYAEIDVDNLSPEPHPVVDSEARRKVPVTSLVEGMIISDDILAPDGALLVAHGTVASARLIRLLSGLATAGVVLECIPVAGKVNGSLASDA